ncbi:hypothetical protein SBA4_5120004 [Candidatus Sulfopaludibacter sp. SbA4]|nr:hypothetical protein SBA4_5120004 [Candidatus Sulfopaludibacter sp. SbA4]
MNPYDCSRPGNLFVGYRDILRGMREKLVENRRSFSVQGGRRCGKTSLLKKLGEELGASAPAWLRWRPIDMQAVVPHTWADLFLAIYREMVAGIPGAPPAPDSLNHYDPDFLNLLDAARPAMEAQLGHRWITVLGVDDFDVAAVTLPDDRAFQHLRSLLMASRHADFVRLVAAGSSRMNDLIKAGSALNNLDPVFLGILPEADAREVLRAGFPDGKIEQELFAATGRHPYILQGVLGYLWEDRDKLDLVAACRRFTRDRMPTFKQWMKDMGEGGAKIYGKLAAANGGVPVKALKVRGLMLDDILQTLSYHGLIDDADPDRPRVSSDIFRRWFLQNADVEAYSPTQEPAATPVKKVFVVHGRDQKIRASMFHFLRELGLEPLEWGDLVEATGNPTPTIIEVLRAGFEVAQAAVVIFTPDDEARLNSKFCTDEDPADERELTPQPRPNVIFEAGMVMAHFPRRTVIVQIGKMRQFTDLSGIHFVKLDNSMDARRELARRLRMAGCEIGAAETETGWHTAGKFEV